MQANLTPELYWLTLTTILTGLMWVPYIVNRVLEKGQMPALKAYGELARPEAEWAKRAVCAHNNAVENLVLFGALVLVIQTAGLNSPETATACMIYFWARLGHLVIFLAGIPVLRTAIFCVGFVVQAYLALTILGLA